MKIASVWATLALLTTCAPAALAQATPTTASPTTATSATTPSCTASLITRLCDYKEPGPEFAVAIESNASCWRYCDAHQPCNFAIFAAGNPHTGTGTCWLYPGEDFDKSAGTTDCGNPYLYVYSKPSCAGGSPTSEGACSATASPSAVASVCGYPAPEDCFYTCIASEGASSCLSSCADADSCSYAVFNPHNPSNSPYASGTCWVYSNGTFDAGSTTPCSGPAEQYVYSNVCPKPKPSLSPASSGAGSPSSSSPSSPSGATASTGTVVGVGNAQSNPTGGSPNSAPGILSPSNLWAAGGGMALFTWLQGLC